MSVEVGLAAADAAYRAARTRAARDTADAALARLAAGDFLGFIG